MHKKNPVIDQEPVDVEPKDQGKEAYHFPRHGITVLANSYADAKLQLDRILVNNNSL